MFSHFSTGLVAAILLVGLSVVQVRAINEPPTVWMTFHNANDKTVKVQFIARAA